MNLSSPEQKCHFRLDMGDRMSEFAESEHKGFFSLHTYVRIDHDNPLVLSMTFKSAIHNAL
jgi:hypothetical protein